MTLNDIENIWLRRASLLLFPILIPLAILWSMGAACWTEVLQYVPEAFVDATLLMWNPKKTYR